MFQPCVTDFSTGREVGGKVGDDLGELFSMLSCFVKNFEDKTNIVYWLAYEAMASLCENEHQNILDYLIANKRYNAVAHIVQRFPAESGTYS